MLAAQGAARSRAFPIHAILLAFPIALFSTGLVTDIAYLKTAEIQWSNFSAWLVAGALVFGGVVGVWALVELALGWRGVGRRRSLVYVLVLTAMWILGLINAFQHSRDGWSSVGTVGLLLSLATTVLALAAGWLAYSRADRRETVG